MYVQIENNKIKRRGQLPKAFKNVSGFDKLDDASLKEYGFYPAELNIPDIDIEEQELGNLVFSIDNNDKAILSYEVKNLVKKVKDERIANKRKQLKMMASQLLKNTDFIMLDDNGLDVNNLAKLKDMRLNLMGLESKLSSITKPKAKNLFNLVRDAAKKSEDRFNIFNTEMEALANFLETL